MVAPLTAAGRSLRLLLLVCPLAALALTVGAAPALAANVSLVNVASTVANGGSIVISKPTGTAAGNVMVAQIAEQGGGPGGFPTITAPSGWSQIRSETGSAIMQTLYYKVAGSSEGSSYTWTLSKNAHVSGGIATYSGNDRSSPIDTSSGQVSSSNGTSMTAPAVTTGAANEMILGFFSTGANSTSTPPSGMTERWDVQQSGLGSNLGTSMDDVLQSSAGSSGSKTATSASSSSWVAQLVAIQPPPCSSGSLSMAAPGSTSFGALTLNGTNQTTTATVQLTPDDETGSWPGWNITGTSTTFSDGSGHSLSTSATSDTAASASAATGNCNLPTNSITYPVTLPAGASPPTAVKLYNAAAGTGEGPTNVTLTFQLAVPANTFRGTYTSTWTFAIVSGP